MWCFLRWKMFGFLERLLVYAAFFRPSSESMLNTLNSFISINCVVVVSGSCVQRLPVRSGGHRRVPQSSSPQRKPPPGGVCQCVQLPPLVIHALASPLGTLSLSFTWKVDFWVITNTNQSCAEFNKVFISKNCHHYSNRSCRDLNLCVHDFQNWNFTHRWLSRWPAFGIRKINYFINILEVMFIVTSNW